MTRSIFEGLCRRSIAQAWKHQFTLIMLTLRHEKSASIVFAFHRRFSRLLNISQFVKICLKWAECKREVSFHSAWQWKSEKLKLTLQFTSVIQIKMHINIAHATTCTFHSTAKIEICIAWVEPSAKVTHKHLAIRGRLESVWWSRSWWTAELVQKRDPT